MGVMWLFGCEVEVDRGQVGGCWIWPFLASLEGLGAVLLGVSMTFVWEPGEFRRVDEVCSDLCVLLASSRRCL